MRTANTVHLRCTQLYSTWQYRLQLAKGKTSRKDMLARPRKDDVVILVLPCFRFGSITGMQVADANAVTSFTTLKAMLLS